MSDDASVDPSGETGDTAGLDTDVRFDPSPVDTGVGDYCTTRDIGGQRWLLFFDDADMQRPIYDNEADARHAFAMAEARGWNCHLFQTCRRASTVALSDDDSDALGKENPMATQQAVNDAFYEGVCTILERHIEYQDDPLDGLDREELAEYVGRCPGFFPTIERWLETH